MADVLHARRWWTVVERDTSAMCPHGHSPDKGSRVPEVCKQHGEDSQHHQPTRQFQRAEGADGRSHGSAAQPRSPWIMRHPAHRSEGADENVLAVTILGVLPTCAVKRSPSRFARNRTGDIRAPCLALEEGKP